MPPTPLPPRRPLFSPEPPRRRFNRLAIFLAIGIALLFIPLTLHYQQERVRELHARHVPTPTPTPAKSIEEAGDQSVPAELRQWHMDDVDGMTESQALKRFGNPLLSREYNVTYGAFLGPKFGLKHYHLTNAPDYAQLEKDAQKVWNFPQYATIREMIFKMHESYLTLWMYEPRVEVSIKDGTADALFPRTKAGEWVVLDNYRVGQDLVRNPPVAATPAAAP